MRRLLARSFLMLLLLSAFVVPEAFGADGAGPAASFTYSPSAPVTGQLVTFDGNTCASTPCTYVWSDDGPDGPGGTNWSLGSGRVLTFTFHRSGTKYVRLTVTDALGDTSTTERDVTVASSQQPPVAPANTALPAISGSSTAGQTLTTSNGSWTNSPASYAYQWRDCDSSGANCIDISGATSSSYRLVAADIGSTIRAVVTASNVAGEASVTSVTSDATSPVTASGGGGACTTTVSSMSALTTAVASATGGSTVCVAPGSYTGMYLTGTHSSDVTVEPEPNLDPNGAGKVTIGLSSTLKNSTGSTVAGYVDRFATHIVIRNFYFTSSVDLGWGTDFITIDHNDLDMESGSGDGMIIDFLTTDCTVYNAPTWPNCGPQPPVSDVTISGNKLHGITANAADVLHTNNFRNLHITGNDIYNAVENGSHVDCQQNVYGGSNETFDHNYEHDNECQGIFLKDGDITNVTFDENLFVRDNVPAVNGGSSFSLSQFVSTKNVVAEHNTIWDRKGIVFRCFSPSSQCTATVDQNVMSQLTTRSNGDANLYRVTENNNIFGTSPWSFTPASTDQINANPAFKCAAKCGDGTPAGDDYELASNPDGIGIDWSPASQQYGPTN